MIRSEEQLLEDILAACQHLIGRQLDAKPVKRGWLNLKWKVVTDSGTYLVKQYNPERYRLYKQDKLLLALNEQVRLHAAGLACPRLLTEDQTIMFASEKGDLFIVMEYCSGEVIPAGQSNARQLYELGKATGRMHRLLNDGALGSIALPVFEPPRKQVRIDHWNTLTNKLPAGISSHLADEFEVQRRATEAFSTKLLASYQSGWAHRDLWADNLLFAGDKLTAILDFDRLDYDYPQADAARAVMSCAWNEQELDMRLAYAFMEGYTEERQTAEGYLTNGLQLLWYMESTWWITGDMDNHSVPPARFAREMRWLAENMAYLPDMLDGL
ncbi:homoserine kinase [Paenibacillus sambharensis]|uniref:Homoserine kinase n=1 Tax=Paenibacillus sambharensis TaxID=1803190 RepID=A0A2W1LLI6_9BACL|nr:phosphotransferase [Paenibacillus sambharensis]PZD95822.1 homoserine kinase [Paenibacillus sambharensis]